MTGAPLCAPPLGSALRSDVPGAMGAWVIFSQGGVVPTQEPLSIVEDPRILASGVTNADLQALFEHNSRVLKLVHDTTMDVVRVNAALSDLFRPKRGNDPQTR